MGQTISISLLKPSTEMAATVLRISSEQVYLELTRPTSQRSFQEGERVRIKYWNEQEVYYFDSDILRVFGFSHQQLAISRPSEGVAVQRRKAYRVRKAVPFSFTVIEAAEAHLIGEKIDQSRTENLSVGGLAFDTDLPLRLRDKLEINLHLPSSQAVNAVAWVV